MSHEPSPEPSSAGDGDSPEPTDPGLDEVDSVVVVAVTEESEPEVPDTDIEALAEANRHEIDKTLADVQLQLADMAKTGIPGVDEALDRLAQLDPNDLPGSTRILSDVLAKLESVMGEAPEG